MRALAIGRCRPCGCRCCCCKRICVCCSISGSGPPPRATSSPAPPTCELALPAPPSPPSPLEDPRLTPNPAEDPGLPPSPPTDPNGPPIPPVDPRLPLVPRLAGAVGAQVRFKEARGCSKRRSSLLLAAHEPEWKGIELIPARALLRGIPPIPPSPRALASRAAGSACATTVVAPPADLARASRAAGSVCAVLPTLTLWKLGIFPFKPPLTGSCGASSDATLAEECRMGGKPCVGAP